MSDQSDADDAINSANSVLAQTMAAQTSAAQAETAVGVATIGDGCYNAANGAIRHPVVNEP